MGDGRGLSRSLIIIIKGSNVSSAIFNCQIEL